MLNENSELANRDRTQFETIISRWRGCNDGIQVQTNLIALCMNDLVGSEPPMEGVKDEGGVAGEEFILKKLSDLICDLELKLAGLERQTSRLTSLLNVSL